MSVNPDDKNTAPASATEAIPPYRMELYLARKKCLDKTLADSPQAREMYLKRKAAENQTASSCLITLDGALSYRYPDHRLLAIDEDFKKVFVFSPAGCRWVAIDKISEWIDCWESRQIPLPEPPVRLVGTEDKKGAR